MKLRNTITFILLSIFASGNVLANIKPAADPSEPFNGSDYVGTVEAAIYDNYNGQRELLILTRPDKKNTNNHLASFNLKIDGDDLPWGMVLASSVGKKIAVSFRGGSSGSYQDISAVNVITDEYYYGTDK